MRLPEKAKAARDSGEHNWMFIGVSDEEKALIEMGFKHGFMNGYLLRQEENLVEVDAQLKKFKP